MRSICVEVVEVVNTVGGEEVDGEEEVEKEVEEMETEQEQEQEQEGLVVELHLL